MKTDRLLGITVYLLNHMKTSAKRLADHFEVSPRTIQRDIESLCLAGIPVVSTYGTDGGDIMDTFKMERQIAGQNDYTYIVASITMLL
jgi:predicted DNA-binding transcriptional regulator YafY